MGFQEITRMQSRQQLAVWVLLEGMSLSEAARLAGVSRPTARLWVDRARASGIGSLTEKSRRPHVQPKLSDEAVVAAVLHALLWPGEESAQVCVRTVDRILQRAGQVRRRQRIETSGAPLRFERSACNELWQIDLKGLPVKTGYSALSLLDDCSRFCLTFEALEDRSTVVIWSAVWQVMGEFGMPDALLSDNGDGFNSTASPGPTRFQANCWLLGIGTTHGRPRHPQTQGKVERLHGTLERELGAALVQPTAQLAQERFDQWRVSYNWERPHEAIGQRVPGAVYVRSSRPRPDTMPRHEPADGATTRKADATGRISYRGNSYLVGKGLSGEHVEVTTDEQDQDQDQVKVRFAGVEFRPLKV
jgi:transposase InsO family protein